MKPRSHHYSGGEVRFSPRPDDSIPVPLTRNYAGRRYGTNTNRYWWGIAHRTRLIRSGEYIRTSEPRGMGLMQFLDRLPEPYSPRTETARRQWDAMNALPPFRKDAQ